MSGLLEYSSLLWKAIKPNKRSLVFKFAHFLYHRIFITIIIL